MLTTINIEHCLIFCTYHQLSTITGSLHHSDTKNLSQNLPCTPQCVLQTFCTQHTLCIDPSLFPQSFRFTTVAPLLYPAKLELKETDENQVKNGGSSHFPFSIPPSIFLLILLLLSPLFPPSRYIFSAYIPLWPRPSVQSITKTYKLFSSFLTHSPVHYTHSNLKLAGTAATLPQCELLRRRTLSSPPSRPHRLSPFSNTKNLSRPSIF